MKLELCIEITRILPHSTSAGVSFQQQHSAQVYRHMKTDELCLVLQKKSVKANSLALSDLNCLMSEPN